MHAARKELSLVYLTKPLLLRWGLTTLAPRALRRSPTEKAGASHGRLSVVFFHTRRGHQSACTCPRRCFLKTSERVGARSCLIGQFSCEEINFFLIIRCALSCCNTISKGQLPRLRRYPPPPGVCPPPPSPFIHELSVLRTISANQIPPHRGETRQLTVRWTLSRATMFSAASRAPPSPQWSPPGGFDWTHSPLSHHMPSINRHRSNGISHFCCCQSVYLVSAFDLR